MPSYNEVDGVPSHANGGCSRTSCAREWGFTGLVVSDYFGDRAAADAPPRRHRQGRRAPRRRSRPASISSCPIRTAFPSSSGSSRAAGSRNRAIDQSVGARAAGEVPRRAVRASVRGSGRAERVDQHRRAPGAGARGGAQVDRPAQEPGRPPAARSRAGEDAGRHRPERQRGCTSAATRAIPGRGVDVLSGITRGGRRRQGRARRGRAHHRARGQLGRRHGASSATRSRTARASRRP